MFALLRSIALGLSLCLVLLPQRTTASRFSGPPLHWVLRHSGTAHDLNAISCPAAAVCYAVGAQGTIRRTQNGGKIWTRVRNPFEGTSRDLISVRCPNRTTCSAVAPPNTVLHTTNGGHTWQKEVIPLPSTLSGLGPIACPVRPECYVLADPAHLFVDSPAIFATKNGGATWTSQSIPASVPCVGDCTTMPYQLEWISCQSATSCLAGGMDFIDSHQGYASAVLATSNGGTTWSLRNFDGAPVVGTCPSSTTCDGVYWQPFTPDTGPYLMRTTNGGTSWNFKNVFQTYSAVACANITFCELAGVHGAVAAATGTTVTIQLGPTVRNLNGVACPRVTACYAVGNHGVILARRS
jgi:photosystem II stability/assembly factor-like uncharacterized protein